MDRRDRLLMGVHDFDWDWWIFSLSFSVLALRDIRKPKWLARLLCKLGKHTWWMTDRRWVNGKRVYNRYLSKCDKCGQFKY